MIDACPEISKYKHLDDNISSGKKGDILTFWNEFSVWYFYCNSTPQVPSHTRGTRKESLVYDARELYIHTG